MEITFGGEELMYSHMEIDYHELTEQYSEKSMRFLWDCYYRFIRMFPSEKFPFRRNIVILYKEDYDKLLETIEKQKETINATAYN